MANIIQDGHKRLSAIASIEDPVLYDKRRKINVIIINNGDLRSNDCWRSRILLKTRGTPRLLIYNFNQ